MAQQGAPASPEIAGDYGAWRDKGCAAHRLRVLCWRGGYVGGPPAAGNLAPLSSLQKIYPPPDGDLKQEGSFN
jgi:hypothetical protein